MSLNECFIDPIRLMGISGCHFWALKGTWGSVAGARWQILAFREPPLTCLTPSIPTSEASGQPPPSHQQMALGSLKHEDGSRTLASGGIAMRFMVEGLQEQRS
jgi:hypothetical protein